MRLAHALLQILRPLCAQGLLAGCGMFGPCTSEAPICASPGHSTSNYVTSLTLAQQERQLRREAVARRPDQVRSFLAGARCVCADRTCGLSTLAREYCGQKGQDCVDELLLAAPEPGYVQIAPGNPRMLERVGVFLSDSGVPRRALLNRVAISLPDCPPGATISPQARANSPWVRANGGRAESVPTCNVWKLALRPLGADAGESPWSSPKGLEQPTHVEADFSLAGVEYTCPAAH